MVASHQPTEPAEPDWYQDPWHPARWRWWDGVAWTAHVHTSQSSKPVLPAWLSLPVLLGLLATPLLFLWLAVERLSVGPLLIGIVLGAVPLVLILPLFTWLDRVEPEPRSSRVHALLWGAAVAPFISFWVNTLVDGFYGFAWSAVVSAPVIEEVTKGLGVVWAVRRREVDGVMDGIIYASWIALGFAATENVLYFAQALEADVLVSTFIARGLVTPFAHPLFTAWIGLAIGLGVARRQSLVASAFWGWGLAVSCHALWNGTVAYVFEAQDAAAALLLFLVAGLFIALFVAAIVTVILIRQHEQRKFVELVPFLAQRHGLTAQEVGVFGNWQQMLSTRRALPPSRRAHFDKVHAALARLALFHRRRDTNVQTEQLLAEQLRQARAAQIAD